MVKKKAAPKPAKTQTFPAIVATWKLKRLLNGRGKPNLATEGNAYLKNSSCEFDVLYTPKGVMAFMTLESGEGIEVPMEALKAFVAMHVEDEKRMKEMKRKAAKGELARS